MFELTVQRYSVIIIIFLVAALFIYAYIEEISTNDTVKMIYLSIVTLLGIFFSIYIFIRYPEIKPEPEKVGIFKQIMNALSNQEVVSAVQSNPGKVFDFLSGLAK